MPPDSFPIVDSILFADTIAADSLLMPPPVAPAIDTLMVGPGGIFGPGSALAQVVRAEAGAGHVSLTDNIAVKGGVLLLFVFYCLIISLFGGQLRSLAGLAAGRKGTNRLLDQQGNLTQSFIRIALWMGVPTLILIVVKAVDMYPPTIPALGAGGPAMSLVVALAVAAALVPIFLCQWSVLRITGALTGQKVFIQRLQMLRRFTGALASVTLTPLAIFWTVSGTGGAEILAFIVAVVAGSVAFLLILRTVQLFSDQKVSFLYWFLYLCAVEIFPVSLIVLLAIR